MPFTTPAKSRRLLVTAAEPAPFGCSELRTFGNGSEAQGVDGANRPRAHRENVAHDAAHAGSRALERLDRARMVMRFNFERDGQSVADIDDSRIFLTRADEDFRRLGRERLQQRARVFVTAMLAPHDGEN